MKHCVILGAPGVGKGTQAKRLKEAYRWTHISTGDMLREAIKSGSEVGREIKNLVDAGNLVPDELIACIIRKRIQMPDCQAGFLLDGFPRTLVQGQMLDEIFDALKLHLDHVFYIDVNEDEIVARLSQRFTCEDCGHIVNGLDHIDNCDFCSGKLKRRKDDEPETVRHRLRVYKENTEPLVMFYEKRGLLERINGLDTVEVVFASFEAVLGKVTEKE